MLKSFPNKKYLTTVLVIAVIGFVASLQLMMEKIELWKNPNYIPSCSINPLFSCQGPMASWQSGALFGVPNPLIGVVAFTVLAVVSITAYSTRMRTWYWWLWTGFIVLGWGYIMWLFTQAVYDIQALCTYCMVMWSIVIPLMWLTVTKFAVAVTGEKKWAVIFHDFRWALIILNYATIILLIYIQFSDFFNTLF